MTTIPALVLLDREVERLTRPRYWQAAHARWRGEPALDGFAGVSDLLAHLRGSGQDTDAEAAALARLAAAGDAAALAVLLATLVGVFVVWARRRGGDSDDTVADLLSLATEVLGAGGLPDRHVLSVAVSRVQSRHRRLRRRTRLLASGGDVLGAVVATDDPARCALARVQLRELSGVVRRHLAAGAFTTDDWCRLVELRVHERTSAELARGGTMTAAAVRKRVQRTADVLGAAVGVASAA